MPQRYCLMPASRPRRPPPRCVWCGQTPGPSGVTADHLVPLGLGGAKAATNRAQCCRPCNAARGRLTHAACRQQVLAARAARCRADPTHPDAPWLAHNARRWNAALPALLALQTEWAGRERRLLGYSPHGAVEFVPLGDDGFPAGSLPPTKVLA